MTKLAELIKKMEEVKKGNQFPEKSSILFEIQELYRATDPPVITYEEYNHKKDVKDFILITNDDNVLNHYKQLINPNKSLIRPNF